MPVYLVSYDLKKPGQNYEALYKLLQSSGTYAHVLDSAWLVNSPLAAKDVLLALTPALDKNDSIFVTQVSGAAWQLPVKFNDWLKHQLNAGPIPHPDKP